MIDKITALAVPPGNSLTDAPGKWAWEQPPRFSNPDDAIDHTLEMIENGTVKDDMLKMMFAGITVEELVEQITFKGFMSGAISPDVAEIIKPALGVFLVNMAIEEGFEPQMFVENPKVEGGVTDEALFTIMKERNPDLFSGMIEELNRMEREQIDELVAESDAPVEMEQKPSFLNSGEER